MEWEVAVENWRKLKSDVDAVFDKELSFDASLIERMITYGTNPGMGMSITENIPSIDSIDNESEESFKKSLEYMGFEVGQTLEGYPIDYVFLGSCTNGRIEDFRAFASIVKGRKKADNVVAWLVPGSWLVRQQIIDEGIDKILEEAGFELRLPSCSSCLAMNPDKLKGDQICASTSNRNFKGRQGSPTGRTLLMSPIMAAAAAITGTVADAREVFDIQ